MPPTTSASAAAPLHVVLGAGQLGPPVAARLAARGLRVRLVRRGAFAAAPPPGVTHVAADVLDPAALAAALDGAAVVYHCVNPLYTQWDELLLPLSRAIAAGAARAGARLVVLDNLYMYGHAPGGVMREDTPVAPCSRKGELRARAAAELLEARARGDLRVTIGRASDFYGPGAVLAAVFGDRFWPRALAGRAGEVFGDPDQPHSYSYVPDVADALVTLGTDARATEPLYHLPVAPAEPTRAVFARIAAALGHPVPARAVPTWLLRGAGLVSPLVREVAEMTYQWKAPFILDDRKFRATFGRGATSWDDGIAATVAWARAHYAPAASRRAA